MEEIEKIGPQPPPPCSTALFNGTVVRDRHVAVNHTNTFQQNSADFYLPKNAEYLRVRYVQQVDLALAKQSKINILDTLQPGNHRGF